MNLTVPLKNKAVVLKLEPYQGSLLPNDYNIITLNNNRSFGWIFLEKEFQSIFVKDIQEIENSDQIILEMSEYPDIKTLSPEHQTEILITVFPVAKSAEKKVPNYEEKL